MRLTSNTRPRTFKGQHSLREVWHAELCLYTVAGAVPVHATISREDWQVGEDAPAE